MHNHGDNVADLRKKLLWRATHRGIKEMDLIAGGFARQHLEAMSDEELRVFAAILEIPDQDLLSWATRQSKVPASAASPMLQAMLAFEPETALKPGSK
jgi:antitoxin CptB